MKAYFDDSRSDGVAWTVAGYAATNDLWEHFEREWQSVLDQSGVPYFHMNEMRDPAGVFAKWCPPEDHKEELAEFFYRLCRVVGFCQLEGFHVTVREADLYRFNKDFDQSLEAYSLAAWAVLLQLGRTYPATPIEAFFDRADQVSKKLCVANEYLLSDRRNPDTCDNVVAIPLPKGFGFKTVRPLQAADFVAWEARKHHNTISAWFEIENRPDNTTVARFEHLTEWLRMQFGEPHKSRRKSWDELLCRSPHQGGILDYDTLCSIHRARGGIWSVSALPDAEKRA